MLRPLHLHFILLATFFLALAGHAYGAPLETFRRTSVTRRKVSQNDNSAFPGPESLMTSTTTDTPLGAVMEICSITLTPEVGPNGEDLVREDKLCDVSLNPAAHNGNGNEGSNAGGVGMGSPNGVGTPDGAGSPNGVGGPPVGSGSANGLGSPPPISPTPSGSGSQPGAEVLPSPPTPSGAATPSGAGTPNPPGPFNSPPQPMPSPMGMPSPSSGMPPSPSGMPSSPSGMPSSPSGIPAFTSPGSNNSSNPTGSPSLGANNTAPSTTAMGGAPSASPAVNGTSTMNGTLVPPFGGSSSASPSGGLSLSPTEGTISPSVSATPTTGSGSSASSSPSPSATPVSSVHASTTSSGAASSSTDGSGNLAQLSGTSASATSSPFSLPGQQLQVLPIGLGVFAGISVIALIVVGLVTYERTKYRKAFRQRKLAEQGQTSDYSGMAERPAT